MPFPVPVPRPARRGSGAGRPLDGCRSTANSVPSANGLARSDGGRKRIASPHRKLAAGPTGPPARREIKPRQYGAPGLDRMACRPERRVACPVVLCGSAPAHEVRGLTVEEWPRRGPQSWGCRPVQAKTYVALDVHVSSTVAAIIDRDSGELRRQRLSGRGGEVCEFVAALPGPVRVTYEAGPTGFALARRLQAAGVECLVCAPGLIPRGPSDRVKTDRRDAERLVRLLIAGELHRVAVPTVEAEGLRDLVRAREDLRGDLMSARHRVAKLLLRHDVRFDGEQRNWTQPHLRWLSTVRFDQPGTQAAFDDYRGAVEALVIRRSELEARIAEQLPTSPWAQTAKRLMCLRGIDTLTAAGLCAEIGHFDRFRHPAQVMSYLGVTPS